jgi:hypothetical protein
LNNEDKKDDTETKKLLMKTTLDGNVSSFEFEPEV